MIQRPQSVQLLQGQHQALVWRRVHEVEVDQVINSFLQVLFLYSFQQKSSQQKNKPL